MSQSPSQPRLLSLIIPAYNEAKYLPGTLETACKFLLKQGFPFEIIVVDDGSKDGTSTTVKDVGQVHREVRLVQHPTNFGKGAAVRTGIKYAAGDYMIFTDADLSYAIEDVNTVLRILRGGADMAIGSRTHIDSSSEVHPPLIRRLLSLVFSSAVQTIAVRGITDTQCGFKGFRKQAGREIFKRLTIRGFAFDVEALVIAKSLGYRIEQVPVHFIAHGTSKVHVIRDSLSMFIQLLRIRSNERRGLYREPKLSSFEEIEWDQGSQKVGD